MSESEFLDHWMRIGTAHKVELATSRFFNRALTGSKGIGRLSAQFLASEMELWSTSTDQPDQTLYAIVDWRNVTRGRDLDTVEVLWEMRTESPTYPNGYKTGTKISLQGLKTEWDTESLENLGRDVWILRSPFKSSQNQSNDRNPEDFYIQIDAPGIEDAGDAFDKMRANLFANWRARIRGTLDQGRRYGKATVTIEFQPGYPDGMESLTRFSETISIPVRNEDGQMLPLIDCMAFDILIFKPEGRQAGGISVSDMRSYLTKFGNVSVYDAGFRLPYYGSGEDKTGQDWLNIAVDQGRRLNVSELLPDHLKAPTRYMQDLPAPGRLFGAVEIDTNHERLIARQLGSSPDEWLQIQSSRDRLHNNPAFFQMRDFVRFALDYYANRHRTLLLQVAEQQRDREPPSRKFDRALDTLNVNRAEIPAAVYQDVEREISAAQRASVAEENVLDQRAALFGPLATAGMTALALAHELAREIRFLDRASQKVQRLANAHALPELNTMALEFDDLRRRLDALQELFAPLLSETDMAPTDRLRVRPLVQQVARSMRPLLPRVEFDLRGISGSLSFPLGSFAEWNAILQNVIANAWNAMLSAGRFEISFDGDRGRGGREWLRISDTGQGLGVPLDQSSRLFEPFERDLEISLDNRSIALGGQGLGLTIVRMIAHQRAANVRFVNPPPGFSTTFELSWRGARR